MSLVPENSVLQRGIEIDIKDCLLKIDLFLKEGKKKEKY